MTFRKFYISLGNWSLFLSSNVIVGCTYRHPCMSISDFNTHYLSVFLDKLLSKNKGLILLGDFNIDILKSESSNCENEFLDLLGSHPCFPHITLPTRVTDNTSTLIDNIFSSPDLSTKSISGNLTIAISDHMPQILLLQKSKNKHDEKENIFQHVRDWSNFTKNDFILDYFSYDWENIVNNNDNNVDNSFNKFYNQLTELINKHIPFKKLNKKQRQRFHKLWITKGF